MLFASSFHKTKNKEGMFRCAFFFYWIDSRAEHGQT